MRSIVMLSAMLMLVGCSKFDGEWLEDGVMHPDGYLVSSTGERRMAVKFDVPSTVRTGLYVQRTGVVDAKSVQTDNYFLFDGFNAAQFGGMTAKIDGDHLLANVPLGPVHRFSRVPGHSIFPPPVLFPELVKGNTSPGVGG